MWSDHLQEQVLKLTSESEKNSMYKPFSSSRIIVFNLRYAHLIKRKPAKS